MKNKKSFKEIYPIIVMAIALIIGIYLFLKEAMEIASPPYCHVEHYEFNIGSDELVSEIDKFKEKNPNLKLPVNLLYDNSSENDSTDKTQNFRDYPLINFYYSDKHYILTTFVFGKDKSHSNLGFSGFTNLNEETSTSTGYKEINNSLGCSENKKQLKLFEERIVNPLHKQIREKYKNLKPKK